jgi:hypothetical protein
MMQDLFVHQTQHAHAHEKFIDIAKWIAGFKQLCVEAVFHARVWRRNLSAMRLHLWLRSDTLEFIQGIALMVSLAGLMFFMLLL